MSDIITAQAVSAQKDNLEDVYDDIYLAAATSAGAMAAFKAASAYAEFYNKYKHLPGFFDPREAQARKLFMHGHASVDEILKASLGEWPVKGLVITGENSQRVRFSELFFDPILGKSQGIPQPPLKSLRGRMEYYSKTPAHAYLNGERRIGINAWECVIKPALIGRSSLASAFGHEATHISQGDHYYRARSLFGQHPDLQKIWQQGSVRSDKIANSLFHVYGGASPVGVLSDKELKHVAYLKQGTEIQARIHQIMAEGYQKWGQWPSKSDHAVIAMKNMGADVPDDVINRLRYLHDFETANKTFSKASMPQVVMDRMHDINFLKSTMTPDGWAWFWKYTMPDLYSDLAGIHGDRRFKASGFDVYPEKQVAQSAQKPFSNVFRNTAVDAAAMVKEMGGPLAIGKDIVGQMKNIRGGFVMNAVMGVTAGGVAFATGHSLAESGRLSVEMIVPYADAAMKAAGGDRMGAIHSTMTETAGIAGAIAGASGGAMAGAALGSIVPVIGTAIGGVAGGIFGGVAGGIGMHIGADIILKEVPQITDAVDRQLTIAERFVERAYDRVANAMTILTGGDMYCLQVGRPQHGVAITPPTFIHQ